MGQRGQISMGPDDDCMRGPDVHVTGYGPRPDSQVAVCMIARYLQLKTVLCATNVKSHANSWII